MAKAESYVLRMNYGKIPEPLPEQVLYWCTYLEALEYAYNLFKDDSVNQMQLLK